MTKKILKVLKYTLLHLSLNDWVFPCRQLQSFSKTEVKLLVRVCCDWWISIHVDLLIS